MPWCPKVMKSTKERISFGVAAHPLDLGTLTLKTPHRSVVQRYSTIPPRVASVIHSESSGAASKVLRRIPCFYLRPFSLPFFPPFSPFFPPPSPLPISPLKLHPISPPGRREGPEQIHFLLRAAPPMVASAVGFLKKC